MLLKDYYQILELGPSATLPEIKKAYRKLARQYHPDKNDNNAVATARFVEIKEAYEVLSNPGKKEYYLQQCWYDQNTGKRKKQGVFDPEKILLQTLELEKYISRLDYFRMDKAGLYNYIMDLISDTTIEKLNAGNAVDINEKIISVLLRCLQPLPFSYILPLCKQLNKIGADTITKEKINAVLLRHQKEHKKTG